MLLSRIPPFRCVLPAVRWFSIKRRGMDARERRTQMIATKEAHAADGKMITVDDVEYPWSSIPKWAQTSSLLTVLRHLKIPIENHCDGKRECRKCTVECEGIEGTQLACGMAVAPGMVVTVKPVAEEDSRPSSLSEEIKEASQIADFVIEQLEHRCHSAEGDSHAVQYDMTGQAKKLATHLETKLGMNRIHHLLGSKPYLHVDNSDLHDMDALIIAKLLRFHNSPATLLDINNNPRLGDVGVKHIAHHVLGRESGGHNLGSLFLSGVGMTDIGVGYIAEALKTNRGLSILELRNNQITDEGVTALASVIANQNKMLTSLYLSGNAKITDKSVMDLAVAVAKRRGHFKVTLLDCPGISFETKSEISQMTRKKIRF